MGEPKSPKSEFTGKLVHCGLVMSETEQLLHYYVDSGEDWSRVRESVLSRNLLGKQSKNRARHIFEVVQHRYKEAPEWLPPTAFVSKFYNASISERAKKQIGLTYVAADDPLLRKMLFTFRNDFQKEALAPRDTVIIQEMHKVLDRENVDLDWSPSMEQRWAQGFRSILRQVGIIEGIDPGWMRAFNPRPEAFGLLLLWLYEKEGSLRRSLSHKAFDLLLVKDDEIPILLDEGRRRGWWGFSERQGMIETVYEPASLEEWIHALG